MNEIFKPLTENEKDKVAEMEKSRTISDANLLEGGARYVIDDNGQKISMDITKMQEWLAQKQMEISKIGKDKWLEVVEGIVEKEKILDGDGIRIIDDRGKFIDVVYEGIDHGSLVYHKMDDALHIEGIEIVNIMSLHKL